MFCKASRSKSFCPFALTVLAILCCLSSVTGQQTTSFTYQGRLTDSGSPANGNYDLQFALFDSLLGGAQIGSTLTRSGVLVSAGAFTVQLDFTVSAFPGADRFLEIGVRPAGFGSFTLLAPRQQISSTPYAIRTLNATASDTLSSACVACVQDSQINQVSGSKVNGTIPVASVPAASSNYIQNATSQQAGSSFNISGNGIIGGNVGIGTPTPSALLSVVKQGATEPNVQGVPTAMKVGTPSGTVPLALRQNVSASGTPSLLYLETADGALGALGANSSGLVLGSATNLGLSLNAGGTTAVAIDSSGRLIIGPAVNTSLVQLAVQTTAATNLAISGYSPSGRGIQGSSDTGYAGYFIGNMKVSGSLELDQLGSGGGTSLCLNGPSVFSSNLVSTCGSSIRYKDNVVNLPLGLETILRLRPVTYNWKNSGQADLGLVAEEVNAVAPLLTFNNKDGQIEGVKYDRLTAVLAKGMQEQQLQVDDLKNQNSSLQQQIHKQQKEIEKLKGQVRQFQTNFAVPRSRRRFRSDLRSTKR